MARLLAQYIGYLPVTPKPLTKSFATFGLGSNSQILVANWK